MSIVDVITSLAREVSELKRVVANSSRIGTVHEVDAARGLVRLKFGEGESGPKLGPWVPWTEQGGALKTWAPPSVGQTMVAINPVGDARQGMALNASFSNANPAPSNAGDENVLTFGGYRLTLRGDALHVAGPKVIIESPDVSLGGEGGKRVARIGDKVAVGAGSSAGLWPIVEGSSKVTAAD